MAIQAGKWPGTGIFLRFTTPDLGDEQAGLRPAAGELCRGGRSARRSRGQSRTAARIRPARARERLCGGHAITVVTVGASSSGTVAMPGSR